jgi:hypothetical protein
MLIRRLVTLLKVTSFVYCFTRADTDSKRALSEQDLLQKESDSGSRKFEIGAVTKSELNYQVLTPVLCTTVWIFSHEKNVPQDC